MRRLKRIGFICLSPRRRAANAPPPAVGVAHPLFGLTPVTALRFPQYAFNLFSHTTKIGENGYNEEEMKMVKETRKIWGVRFTPCRLERGSARGACIASQLPLGCFSGLLERG